MQAELSRQKVTGRSVLDIEAREQVSQLISYCEKELQSLIKSPQNVTQKVAVIPGTVASSPHMSSPARSIEKKTNHSPERRLGASAGSAGSGLMSLGEKTSGRADGMKMLKNYMKNQLDLQESELLSYEVSS